ncbi:hypothetical protein [Flavisolibacter ginsenosidimutans]|uniref:Uncharacterized protein n=1 Tax=Flavisolibacter ginsenosidimutans TaxID=661481 RepID=A0A5B8UG94_9BACT|nr:hypothetical protein [Flavisolibacter ginsenosidimutans]QEC55120.1 hypothetical protein FSB75_04095 [Flavisolibacter ginsenosidimutans]
MSIESLTPFLIIFAIFLIAFLIEALVLYFFKLKKFWASFGISVLVNLVSLTLIYYVAAAVLHALGYDMGKYNGLNLQLPVVAFLWWFSVVVEGLLLCFFFSRHELKRAFIASILMNFLSMLFLYAFIINSH